MDDIKILKNVCTLKHKRGHTGIEDIELSFHYVTQDCYDVMTKYFSLVVRTIHEYRLRNCERRSR